MSGLSATVDEFSPVLFVRRGVIRACAVVFKFIVLQAEKCFSAHVYVIIFDIFWWLNISTHADRNIIWQLLQLPFVFLMMLLVPGSEEEHLANGRGR